MRDEFLNETLFTSLMQARLALEDWRRDYNHVRPHSRIGWLAPAVQTSHHKQAKALRSATVPRLGLLLRLCKMATVRLSANLDKRRGQRHGEHHLGAVGAENGLITCRL
jgi:Integrase core domain